MRRRLWLLLALGAVVIAAVLAAAPRFLARGRAGADQGVTITFRFPEELAGPVERLVGAFHQEHPRIRVLPVPVPGDPARRRESLEREMADLNTVETDLFAVELSWLPAWHAAGWARSLEPLGADQLTEAFVDQAAAAVRFSDGTYGLPWVLEPSLLYYRRDLIEGAGLDPPESWGDVVRLSRQFMDSGAVRWGLVWAGTPPEHLARLFVELVWANGGDLVQDGQVAVARTPAREALAFLRDLIHTHRVSPPAALDGSLAGVRRAFQDGDPLMVHHPPALWRTAAERQAGAERWGGGPVAARAPGDRRGDVGGRLGPGLASADAAPGGGVDFGPVASGARRPAAFGPGDRAPACPGRALSRTRRPGAAAFPVHHVYVSGQQRPAVAGF